MSTSPKQLFIGYLLVATVVDALAAPPQAIAQEVYDSAGIQIVENSDVGTWTRETAWSVDAQPELVIGQSDGEPAELFHNVESVVLLSDGRIAIADRGSAQIRIFAAQGEYLASVGRDGDGPGEFKWLDWVGECREEVLEAFDARLGRVTEIALPTLELINTRLINSPSLGSAPTTVACAQNGLVGLSRRLGIPPPSPGVVRWDFVLELFGRDGQDHVLAEIPGDDRFFNGSSVGPLAFGRQAVLASGPSSLATGSQDSPQVVFWSDSGTPERIVRWHEDGRAVTTGDRRALVRGLVQRASSEGHADRIRASFRTYPFPSHHPAFGRILIDDRDHLWVERSTGPDEEGSEWRVFSPTGVFLGLVRLPQGFRLMSVRSGRVAGVVRDPMDVEYVWVLRVHR